MNLGMLGSGVTPEKTAFVSLPEKTRYTYGALHRGSDALAAQLSSRFEKGDRIAIIDVNSGDFVMVLLAVMKAGLVAVPVNWRLPEVQIRDILEDADVRLVFSDLPLKDAVPPGITREPLKGISSRIKAEGAFTAFEPAERDPAMMLYTSGSTGRPKGVILSHKGHVWTAETRKKRIPLTDEITLIAAPLYHMQALTLIFLVLASGGSAVILPRFTTGGYLKAIEEYACSFITAVPPMIEMLLRDPAIRTTDLTSVKTVRLGSAPAGESLFARIEAVMPNAAVLTSYGTTESGPVTFGLHPDGRKSPPFSAGFKHAEVDIRLNRDNVLEIKSPALMNGYHNRPDIKPFTDDGYYITGDVFSRDEDGFYFFKGRIDDMFVCGGENIYPGEVEKILGTHPQVEGVCVVPAEDDIKGRKPVAFVVKKGGATEDELKQYALEHAAPYLHPRRIWFVRELPVTATSKVDRKLLTAEAAKYLREEKKNA